jgi:hypothetical protein
MKEIKLSNGMVVVVDDLDYEELARHNWWYHADGYAYRQVCKGRTKTYRGKVDSILMHRAIMQTPDGMDTDHINMNKLDNQRHNLRITNRTQNNFNTGIHSNNTSGYRGISWNKRLKRWRVYIGGSLNRTELGHYKNIKEAVLARKRAEVEIIVCG